jgi:hypothetical protein
MILFNQGSYVTFNPDESPLKEQHLACFRRFCILTNYIVEYIFCKLLTEHLLLGSGKLFIG